MPLFTYECKECGHVTEFLETLGKKGVHVCEDCGSKKMQKVFATFAAHSGSTSSSAGSSCPTGTCPLS